MSGDFGGEWLAEAVAELVPAGLPPQERRAAVAQLLDTLERIHRESGVAPPPWLGRARRLHLGADPA